MNILFLLGRYPNYGGTEIVTTLLGNKFHQKGNTVHIVSFDQPFPDLVSELEEGIELHELRFPVRKKSNVKLLRQIVQKYKINVIINQWCFPFYVTQLCRKATKGLHCKLIAVHHGSPDTSGRIENVRIKIKENKRTLKGLLLNLKLIFLKKITFESLRYVYHHSDRYILLSDRFSDIFKRKTHIKNDSKLLAIPNPITLNDRKFTYSTVKKKKEIIYVGRLISTLKRVDRLIDIWEIIGHQYPDWTFTIIGDGPEREKLIKESHERDLERIRFEGYQNPLKYYRRASILILTSEREGLPLVVIEGMNFGVVPIVNGSFPAVFDLIEDGISGFITPLPYQSIDMVSKIKMLMDNPILLDTMAKKAIIQSNCFDITNILNQWHLVLNSLLEDCGN